MEPARILKMSVENKYVIITPAYNEEEYIERVIESVICQSIVPLRWVIVDDGSTDNTKKHIQKFLADYEWISYIRREKVPGHTYYGSNVYAILDGIKEVINVDYDYIAILDADIILCDDYYEKILEKFKLYPELGVATGTYFEIVNGTRVEAKIDRMSTPKALQVFKRKSYEKIGGYIPMKHGGEDSCAEVMVRMVGLQSWSFEEIIVEHLRPVGTRNSSALLMARFKLGFTDYSIGTHPIFMLLKSVKRCVIEKPYLSSGAARFLGFIYGCIKREKRQVPDEVIAYLRKEQLSRLQKIIGIGKKLWRPL